MEEIAYLSATDLLQLLASGRISSSELLEFYIQRYERLNPSINAIVVADFERARSRARATDDARRKGECWGPLHGLPMTIKESIEVAGLPCSSGYPGLKDHISTRNADVTDALLEAGAIIFGKTNCPLFTQDIQTYNDVYGQTNNPWDVTRAPGGSSGGSSAALAGGLTSLEVGSDIGGSIRNPAHFCGVYGHKPSYGVVPVRGHIPPRLATMNTDYEYDEDMLVIGPMARSATDLQLLMNILAAPRARGKPEACTAALAQGKPRPHGFRVAAWLEHPAYPVDRKVKHCLQSFVDQLANAGIAIDNARPQIDFAHSHDVYTKLLYANGSPGLSEKIFERAQGRLARLAPQDKSYGAQWIRGVTLSYRDWKNLQYERLQIRQQWADFFGDFDVLLCPVVAVTAFQHDHGSIFDRTLTVNDMACNYLDALLPWCGLVNVSYLPSTVVPAGLAEDGMPVGIQIVGPYLGDRTTIRFARLVETLVGGFRAPAACKN